MTMSAISLPSSLSRGAPARVAPGSRRGPRRVAARQPACRGRRATRCVASAGEERITVIGEALWAGPVHVRRSLPGIPRVPVLRHPTVTQARWSGSPNPPPVCPASRRARSARPSINPDSIALRGYERRYSPFQGPCRPYLYLGKRKTGVLSDWRSSSTHRAQRAPHDRSRRGRPIRTVVLAPQPNPRARTRSLLSGDTLQAHGAFCPDPGVRTRCRPGFSWAARPPMWRATSTAGPLIYLGISSPSTPLPLPLSPHLPSPQRNNRMGPSSLG